MRSDGYRWCRKQAAGGEGCHRNACSYRQEAASFHIVTAFCGVVFHGDGAVLLAEPGYPVKQGVPHQHGMASGGFGENIPGVSHPDECFGFLLCSSRISRARPQFMRPQFILGVSSPGWAPIYKSRAGARRSQEGAFGWSENPNFPPRSAPYESNLSKT